MAFSTQNDDNDVISEINITPLVDVMLVLLVAFIVTAPLMTNAVKVNLPKTATTQAPENRRPVSVTVDAASKVYLDRKEIGAEALGTELKALRTDNPELTLHLQADQDVPYKSVAKVMAVIERAGGTRLAVITASQ
ncbi:biopolymer transporter ExbD [Noviherbaspirillum cavernae]|uniref:Biopolymer transporter ExbD n=1 Tax=Noviherbaspirillum cavernae TaxID=2320862 RepID=A0A418WZ40_9BURK|nr:biopolymer transporter ExbD [Noviherbaspirillum cavernae]RJG05500.1 biopolymer transporter ExbD [Noviherbaspirillum cavernae]